jgi:hypothetical protein
MLQLPVIAMVAVMLTSLLTTEAFTLHPTTTTMRKDMLSQEGRGVENQQSIIVLGMEGKNDAREESNGHGYGAPSRRLFLFTSLAAGTGALVFSPNAALAGIDVSALRNLPVEGDASGTATRLKQLQGTQIQPADRPYTNLANGVSYREYRSGKDGAVVRPGSRVGTEMSIRCKSYATSTEPEGSKYYSTKDDTDFNDLGWTIGSGEFSAALEEGMLGMKKNSIRHIEVPSTQVFAARNAGQLPEATTEEGQRRYESLFKTDATLVFEILVTRIN